MILLGRPYSISKKISLGVFIGLTFVTLIVLPFNEYFFNVVTVSYQTIFRSEIQNIQNNGILDIIRIFFYPAFLFFGGDWNVFRPFMVGLSSIFLLLILYLSFIKKQFKLIGVMILILGFANFRPVDPIGRMYYEAFHMLSWYGIFIFLIFLMEGYINKYNKIVSYLTLTSSVGLFLYITLSPSSFIHGKRDTHEEFLTNFGKELQVGEVVKILSKPSDTLFLDGFDDLIYWQAKRMSSYKYSWYTSVMPAFPKYTKARLEMFKNNPPDFYYGSCPKDTNNYRLLPQNTRHEYQQLYSRSKPTCLYIKKTKIPYISSESWKKAKDFSYELP